MRARLFAAMGWVKTIEPEEWSVERLAKMILASLNEGSQRAITDRANLEGLSATANQLLSLFPIPPPVNVTFNEVKGERSGEVADSRAISLVVNS
jgi:hypothetical protein